MPADHTPKHSAARSAARQGILTLTHRLRRGWHRARSLVALTTAAVLVLAISVVGTVAIAGSSSPAAATTPGSPGTTQAGTTVYQETFANAGGGTATPIQDYTGDAAADDEPYTADPYWQAGTDSNGWILNASTPQPSSDPSLSGSNVNGLSAWTNLQNLVGVLGQADGFGANNFAVAEQTNGSSPGGPVAAPGAEVETTSNNIPMVAGHYYDISAYFGAIDYAGTTTTNCDGSDPSLTFSLLSSSLGAQAIGSGLDPCTAPGATQYAVDGRDYVAAKLISNAYRWPANAGSTAGVELFNANGSGGGNDGAFSDPVVTDVTPQLDKSFSPASVQVGQSSTLTFTITNTSELGAKDGWSFSDALPAGLTVTGPAASTTCPAGVVTAAAGGSSVQVTGDLSAGMASCTVSVNVTAGTAGSYTNGPGNVTETGLNPPGSTTVTFTVPTVSCSTDPNVFNTGYDAATGGVLANGSNDARWMVAGGYDGFYYPNGTTPPTATPLPPAGAVFSPGQVGNAVPSAWAASPYGNAQWISAYYPAGGAQNQANGSGDWYYQYQFNLDPAVDPASFALHIDWLADNTVASVWVNGTQKYLGTSTNPYQDGDFVQSNAVSTLLDSGWQTGLNTILVEVKSYWTFEGFDAQVQPSQLCPTVTVTKDVAGRVQAADQFTVGLRDSNGTVLTSATTTGAQNTVTTTPAYVRVGSTYTITDAMAAGSVSPLSDYRTALVCTDTTTKQSVPVTGSGPTWSLTPTGADAYDCTVTNTGAAPAYTVRKTASATGPVHAGDTVTYTVRVTNSTLIPYTAGSPATFTDDLSGVLDDAGYNNDATNGATVSGTTLSWSGALAPAGSPGDTVTVTYSVTVNSPDVGDKQLTNTVVGGTNCPAGSTDPACSTSTPVQSFRVVKTTTATAVTPGTTVPYTITVTNTGAAAYTAGDPASFTDDLTAVLDDAAYNGDVAASAGTASYAAPVLSWSGPLAVGQTVTITYSVTVNAPDTGDQQLGNTVVTPGGSGGNCATGSTDPACSALVPTQSFSVSKAASQTTASPGDTVTYTITVHNTGAADYTSQAPATFTDDLSGVLDDAGYNNDAVASSGPAPSYDPAGKTLSWSGPLTVGQTITVTYSVTVHTPDTGDHRMLNTVGNPPGIGGGCQPGSTDPGCSSVVPVRSYTVTKTASPATATTPGATVTYTVTVTNTGQVAYTAGSPATFSDDLSGVLDDASFGSADNGASFDGVHTLSWSGAVGIGDSVRVTYTVTVDNPDTGDHVLTNAITGGQCTQPSTDPGCGTVTRVADYTVAKTVDESTASPGDTVTYTVVVQNTGQVAYTDAAPATFSDDLSGVLDDATYDGDATAGATVTGTTLAWSGALPIGAAVTIRYSVTVDRPDTGDHTLTNTVVGGGNCPAGSSNPACTPPPVLIGESTVTKAASATTVNPGDTVTYTLTVHNTGAVAYTAADPATVTDNLAGVLDDATYNNDADNGATYAAPVLSWSGALGIGDSITITYSVTVNSPDTGDGDLPNTALGGDCVSPTDPGCGSDVKVQSYSAVKTVDQANVKPGETVTYTITLTNTGQVPYTVNDPASYRDDLTNVLDDATYDNDATGGATYAAPVLSWSGALPVGGTVTVTYSLTVNSPDTGDQKLDNTVVTTGDGGDCPVGSANPDCTAKVPGNKLQVVKTSSAQTAEPGQKVTYTITLTNTGQTDFTAGDPATYTDDLSGVLDDASYDGDASNGATVKGDTLSWSGPLAIGDTTTVTYSATVNSPDTGDAIMKNVVQLPAGENSNCTTGSTDPACATITAVKQYRVVKKASAAKVKPGDTVTYTVTVTNTGQVAFTAADPATFTDDLSQVLDDATYNHDATGGATFAAPTLSWSGALPIAGTVTVTYSVTVKDPDTGDGTLHNVVATPNGEPGNCPADGTDPDCSATSGVQATAVTPPQQGGGGTASTGTDTALQLSLAGLLLAGGALLVLAGIRRRRAA